MTLEYLKKNLEDIRIREEEEGGIVFFPKYLCHFIANNDSLLLITAIKKSFNSNSLISFLNKLSIELGIELCEIENILKIFIQNLESEIHQFESVKRKLGSKKNDEQIQVYEYKSQLKRPIKILLEITNKCNFNCSFCYVYKDKKIDDVLKKEEIFTLINEASLNGVFFIHLTGGEPLCLDYFYDIVSTIREKKMYASLTTNGWYINKQIKALKLFNPIPIEVSLHNVDEDSYKKYINIPNAFQKVIKNIKSLKKNKIKFGIKMVVSKINYDRTYEMAKLANELGAKSVTYIHLTPTGKGKLILELAYLNKVELNEFFIQINKAKHDFPKLLLNYSMFLSIYFPTYSKTYLEYKNFCPSGITDLRIRYDGNAIQCSSNRNTFFGNIRNNSFRNIWKRSFNQKVDCLLLDYSCSALKYLHDS